MAIASALRALEVETLLLGLPDRCLPGGDDEDTGVGALETRTGRRFVAWARALGFTGLLLGPQGETSAGNPSPYDGTIFSRGRIGLAAARLADAEWGRLLDASRIARIVTERPGGDAERIAYRYAHAAHETALAAAYAAFVQRRNAGDGALTPLVGRLESFQRQAWDWLVRDALYEALAAAAPDQPWSAWPEAVDRTLFAPPPGGDDVSAARQHVLLARHADVIARYVFGQFVLHEQHRAARAHARGLGLALWGDLPIGFSERDAWSRQGLFLAGYRLGAPPSRTNPEGQPWNYPVLDPGRPDDVGRLLGARLEKMFAEYDGVRIDHPHGLVCPWVYRADTGDDGAAVRAGARLFSAPDLPDHPALARFAIPRADQLARDPAVRRWDDGWVRDLEPAQIDRYAWRFDLLVDAARRSGHGAQALACEILSTCPYPLRCVLARHGLGRFRVTQKADLHDPQDGYRAENAAAPDWIMVGTHDTASVWTLVDDWRRAGTLRERAEYLAWRLAPTPRERPGFAARLASSAGLLAHAQFADLFASRARHVMIFFTDMFGIPGWYNRPGTVHETNWTLRLPPDHGTVYRRRLARDEALNLPAALAMALRAPRERGDAAALVTRLDAMAEAWRAGDLVQ